MPAPRALMSGASIAGLSTAYWLGRIGWPGAELRRTFAGAGRQTQRVVDGFATSGEVYVDHLTRIRMPSWSAGRIRVTGDAAWCVTPLGGGGTALAMVGGYVLAAYLSQAQPGDRQPPAAAHARVAGRPRRADRPAPPRADGGRRAPLRVGAVRPARSAAAFLGSSHGWTPKSGEDLMIRLWTVVGGAYVALLLAACTVQPDRNPKVAPSPHPYVGMWVTADGHIRQELLPDGRYDEARGERQSAYTGSYRVTGNHIAYADDTGFTADGTFDGDVLHHGGYVFYREGSDAHRHATTR